MTTSAPGGSASEPTSQSEPPPATDAQPTRVLRRSREDRVLAGVCGGLARYFGIDPIMMRLLFVIFALLGGSAVLAYIVLWIVVPEERAGENVGSAATLSVRLDMSPGLQVLGLFLVVIGAATFAQQVIPGIDELVWPVAIIVTGLVLLVHGGSKR